MHEYVCQQKKIATFRRGMILIFGHASVASVFQIFQHLAGVFLWCFSYTSGEQPFRTLHGEKVVHGLYEPREGRAVILDVSTKSSLYGPLPAQQIQTQKVPRDKRWKCQRKQHKDL